MAKYSPSGWAGSLVPVDTTPIGLPEPPASLVEAAARAVPPILADFTPESDGTIGMVASCLTAALRRRGHSIYAACWAVHQLAQEGRLLTGRVYDPIPIVTTRDGSVGGGYSVRLLPAKGTQNYSLFRVVASESLWAWWREFEVPSVLAPHRDERKDMTSKAQDPVALLADLHKEAVGLLDGIELWGEVRALHLHPNSSASRFAVSTVHATTLGFRRALEIMGGAERLQQLAKGLPSPSLADKAAAGVEAVSEVCESLVHSHWSQEAVDTVLVAKLERGVAMLSAFVDEPPADVRLPVVPGPATFLRLVRRKEDDPLWVALGDCLNRLREDPQQTLYEKKTDSDEGFNAKAIDAAAERAALGSVFSRGADDRGLWVEVNHPEGRTPVRWQVSDFLQPKGDWGQAKLTRTLEYLTAWQEAREGQLAGPEGGEADSKLPAAGPAGEGDSVDAAGRALVDWAGALDRYLASLPERTDPSYRPALADYGPGRAADAELARLSEKRPVLVQEIWQTLRDANAVVEKARRTPFGGPQACRDLAPILARLAGRIRAVVELEEAAGPAAEPADTATPAVKRNRRGGRRREYNPKADAKLARDWEAARGKGVYKGDFAKDRGITVKDLDRALNRVRKRKRRAD